jgi:hypothetical protein
MEMHPILHGPERIASISDCSGSVSGYGKASRREASGRARRVWGSSLESWPCLWFCDSRSVTSRRASAGQLRVPRRRWPNSLPRLRRSPGFVPSLAFTSGEGAGKCGSARNNPVQLAAGQLLSRRGGHPSPSSGRLRSACRGVGFARS